MGVVGGGAEGVGIGGHTHYRHTAEGRTPSCRRGVRDVVGDLVGGESCVY